MPEFNVFFPTSRYGTETLNVKAWGARGDGNANTMDTLFAGNLTAAQAVYPKATSLNDTADWCGIQGCIDYALQNNIMHVFIPEGKYLTNDTIHLGYGMIGGVANYQCIVLSGAGYAGLAGYPTGTSIFPQFVDRPVINIQGGRESRVQKLLIQGPIIIPDYGTASLNFRADPANYVPTDAKDDRHAPFCGVCIDGYYATGTSGEATNNPPPDPYPTPRFPAWVQSTTNAYNKAPSSQPSVLDCYITDTLIGIMLQPYSDGNGDFLHCNGTSIGNCKVAVAVGNSQARSMDFTNMLIGNTHTCFDNTSYGHGIANMAGTYTNIHIQQTYRFFNVVAGSGGPLVVTALYGEVNMSLGSATSCNAVFIGCYGSFHDCYLGSQTKGIAAAPGGIVRSGSTVTVTASAPLAGFGWDTDGTTRNVIVQGASPPEYNANVWATRTGANTFTYAIGTTPGAYTGGATFVVYVVTEWHQVPFFEGRGRFYDCSWGDHIIYYFPMKCEFYNTTFIGKAGHEGNDLDLLSAGQRKAVAAFGRVFINQDPNEGSGASPFHGSSNNFHGRRYDTPEAQVNNWDGYNSLYGQTLWGMGQRDGLYSLDYDVWPMATQCSVYGPGSYGTISGITRPYNPTASPISGHVEVGDILNSPGGFPFYAVETVDSGTNLLTVIQLTNFKMESGVYTSLNPDVGTGNPTYYPIGRLDLLIPSESTTGQAGLFLKTTASSTTIDIVDGSGAAVTTMPSGLTEKSKPLWTGRDARGLANSLPFPAHTYIASIDTSAKTITMTANALTTGTWAYGPGIKRLK